jgi:hypothetical protein
MRTEVWYPLVGFTVLAWLVIVLLGAITIPFGKAIPWLAWAGGVFAALLALIAGTYAAQDTWIESAVIWLVHWTIALLIVGVLFVVLVAFIAIAVVPDEWSSVTLSAGLIVGTFFCPILAKDALPPGDVAHVARTAVVAVSGKAVDLTDAWFIEQPGSPSSTTYLASGQAGNVALGQRLAARRGWTGRQWTCLRTMWDRESSWNAKADNPTSSAYGIPQALPGSKMAAAGADWRTNPTTQISWGLNYIADRYQKPCSALAAWNNRSPHWY